MQKHFKTSPPFGIHEEITTDNALYVIKRNGTKQDIKFDKITNRLQKLADFGRPLNVNVVTIAQRVIQGIFPGVTTSELDAHASEVSTQMTKIHPDYAELAGRIKISDLHKNIKPTFSMAMEMAYSDNYNPFLRKNQPLLNDDFIAFVRKYKAELDAAIDLNADYTYDAFACNTLLRSYCLKTREGKPVETIQYTWMRVAIGTSNYDIERALKTYEYLRGKFATHATPTIFNAGTPKPQLSSCFLLTMAGDSIEGIYETLKRCALLSKYAGGIGLNVSDIRASNSYIAGTGGFSNGLKPLMRVFNDTAKYVDQCFVGHSQVLTNEGYVPISNIKEGDRVFTLNGSFERVLKARKYEFNLTNDDQSPKDLRTIGLAHSSMPVVCTDKHPFLTLRTPDGLTIDWTRGNNVVSSLMDRKILVTEWVEAENLRFSDLIAVPLPQWHETMGPEPTEQQCLDKALSIRHLDHGTQSKFPVDYMSIGGTRLVNFLNGLSTTTSRGYGWVENCSHAFANHVSTLIIKMGYFPRFSNTTQFTTNVGFPSALLTGKVSSHIFINNNVAWVPITHLGLVFSTTCANEDILTVYDLDVDNHHNFLTNGGLAHNGGGKRKGSFALYLEPWHADIETFLDQKQNKKTVKNVAADDGVSSPDLFYGLWVPDLFYKRVISNGTWSTFCPNEAPGLTECYGEEFERKYIEYENTKGLPRKVYKAQDLWRRILSNQIETGTPYMLNKDKCNAKSNQQNLGTIKCSNLCTEIVIYTSPDEVGVCNLASLSLPAFFDPKLDGKFDHQKFFEVVSHFAGNLDNVIDLNYYPIPQAEYSNKRNRPIGLGVQGLAEWCFLAKVAYDSPEAISANREIFDTMYFAALTTSCDRARLYGSYPTYEGSPMSKGVLQFDMWSKKPWSNRWDWNSLRQMIAKHGVRNSLLLAPMPTASTSIHLGNTEAFEPQNSNMYTRTTLAGPHQVINRFLVRDLIALGLWTEEIRNMIISDNGSVQNIDQIPQELKQIYKTVWEIKQRVVLEMAADRGIYVDQSMSLNIHLDNPTYAKLTGLLLYAYELGLKTAMYYLRTKAKAQAQKFTIEPVNQKVVQSLASTQPDVQILDEEGPVCTMEEGCLTCGS